jgi:outer membrane protein TolC
MQYGTYVYVSNVVVLGWDFMRYTSLASIFILGTTVLLAQAPGSGGPQSSTRAAQLPLSGASAQAGAVTSQQSAVSGSGAATINSSVQIGGNFAGSVPSGNMPSGPVSLTLTEAVKRGLEANLGPIAANDAARAARAERLQALSALLPNIAANLSDSVQQVNLAAYGFQFNVPANLNFSIPSVVGPFNYSSLQGSLSQSIYDPVARRNYLASKQSERASRLNARDARELVVLAVGGSYLQAVATAARVASQRAQVDNAQAIFRQAEVRKAAGTNARIDVTRSQVELQTEQQRLSSFEADLSKQMIALARLIGLPQDRELILSEPLNFNASAVPEASFAVQSAFQHRADLQASEAQLQAAQRIVSAARAERLPSVSLNGDYGVTGPNPASTHGVFSITAGVNVPIWNGGRTEGDIQQAQAVLHQRQAELADQRGRIEQEVRTALIELRTASGQVRLGENNRSLANETLTEARDRFAAGVATTVEVVQAQQQLASAESDYISSLYSFNLAKLALARATGQAESNFSELLKGNHP